MGVVDGIDGDVEVTDAVPGWQGDVQEDNLQEIDASSLVRKFFNVSHLQLGQSDRACSEMFLLRSRSKYQSTVHPNAQENVCLSKGEELLLTVGFSSQSVCVCSELAPGLDGPTQVDRCRPRTSPNTHTHPR